MFGQIFRKLIERRGFTLTRNDHTDYFCFAALLRHRILSVENFFYIQIGANDGVSFDPIFPIITKYPAKVRGLVIEPLPDAFAHLCENYKGYPEIIKVNKAIHNYEKQMVIHKVDPRKLSSMPTWAKGIASFDKDHHALSGTPAECMISEVVPCISFNELLLEHSVTKVDLLQIDTEGYDSEIILNLPLDKIKPGIIHFEHGLQDGVMSKKTFLSVLEFLNRNGYQLIMENYDATAYQPLLNIKDV